MSVSESLRNDRFKAEVLKRAFPNGDELGCHKFRLGRESCTQCMQEFWNWLEEREDGVYIGAKICPVIGADEVANFRVEEF